VVLVVSSVPVYFEGRLLQDANANIGAGVQEKDANEMFNEAGFVSELEFMPYASQTIVVVLTPTDLRPEVASSKDSKHPNRAFMVRILVSFFFQI
jgi:hypothetical protein